MNSLIAAVTFCTVALVLLYHQSDAAVNSSPTLATAVATSTSVVPKAKKLTKCMEKTNLKFLGAVYKAKKKTYKSAGLKKKTAVAKANYAACAKNVTDPLEKIVQVIAECAVLPTGKTATVTCDNTCVAP